MTARRTRSRKRSATKRSAPPESLRCFVDECLGRYAIPDALRALGVDVVLHRDLFPAGADDAGWLRALAEDPDIIVLTKDSRIRKRPLEFEAMKASGLRVFALSAANLSGGDQAKAFAYALPKIRRLAEVPGPFIARVTASGAVRIL